MWNHTIFVLLWGGKKRLISLEHNVFKVPPSHTMYRYSILFLSWIIPHRLEGPYFAHPFSHQWTPGLFPPPGSRELCCCERGLQIFIWVVAFSSSGDIPKSRIATSIRWFYAQMVFNKCHFLALSKFVRGFLVFTGKSKHPPMALKVLPTFQASSLVTLQSHQITLTCPWAFAHAVSPPQSPLPNSVFWSDI